MKETLEKLKSVVMDLEKEHGPLLIFALFLREDKWDILVSAHWLNPKEMVAYKLISAKLQTALSDSELLQLSRIVILNPEDSTVSFLIDLETIKNGGYKEFSGETLSEKFKFTIKKAYLLRSNKDT